MNYHFPNSFQHEDIRATDFRIWRRRIDLLTGGFPCQPYSTAGKRLGKEDERHLWPEMLRAIREIQPRWIVGENVRGLINWNGGLVFDEVQADLEAEGYEVTPFLLPACGVGAPHRRDRIWFIAHTCSQRTTTGTGGCDESRKLFQEGEWEENKQFDKPISKGWTTSDTDSLNGRCGTRGQDGSKAGDNSEGNASNTFSIGQPGQWRSIDACGAAKDSAWKASWSYDDGRWPTKPGVCSRDDGFPGQLVDLAVSKWRNESLKALGNAIVPQVAHQIFKAIQAYEISTYKE